MIRSVRITGLFLSLLGFWLLLSGRFDPLLLSLGVASAALVTWAMVPVLSAALGDPAATPRLHFLHLVSYFAWLLTRIPPAAIVVARVVLDPRVPPRPGVIRFRTHLPNAAARTLLATSITVVPGTITVDVDADGTFVVHAFTPDAVEDLANASMQNRIARAFRSEPEPPPAFTWDPIRDELPEETL
jgi:multicomponent Na+:H+ antiporter subunit E